MEGHLPGLKDIQERQAGLPAADMQAVRRPGTAVHSPAAAAYSPAPALFLQDLQEPAVQQTKAPQNL